MNEKYKLETIGYTMNTKNPMIHGDMKSATVVQCVPRRGGGASAPPRRRRRVPLKRSGPPKEQTPAPLER